MKKNFQSVKFWAIDDNAATIVPPPVPAKEVLPKWYRDITRGVDGSNTIKVRENGSTTAGVKTCMSYLDSLTSGYIVKLHCDILVENTDQGKTLKWTSQIQPLSSRSNEVSNQLPPVAGFGPFCQAWEMKYAFKLPKGYSMMVTQPFNRTDLPTFATSGIIDADDYLGPGGVPFAIKEDFEGIIEAGTPVLQLFPYKRDDWKSELIETPFPAGDGRARNKIVGWYIQNIWKKKEYL